MTQSKDHVIIVAGGTGLRMQSSVPKQFLEICSKPVLFYTIEAFYRYSPSLEIILVLPENQFDFWEQLCQKHNFKIEHRICAGGKSRFQSVKKGLELIRGGGFVAVHDGVRPLVSRETINRAFLCAKEKGAAVVATSLKESIREKSGQTTVTRDRSQYYLIQTPQVFETSSLKAAYEIPENNQLTDDASVAEAAGIEIFLVDGEYENIKITTPEDVIFAEAILKERIKKSEFN